MGNIYPLKKYLLGVELVMNGQVQENELDSYEYLKDFK